ncbi:hypothetical protein OG272_23560 [Streptomyces sp. NBC_00104]|uniref:hypothetical protein n=1 Tax=Streptomyces sp. NBC_00104 TaxID=2903621 RepID=UPI003243A422
MNETSPKVPADSGRPPFEDAAEGRATTHAPADESAEPQLPRGGPEARPPGRGTGEGGGGGKTPRRRGRIAALATCALLLATTIGAVGYTVRTVDAADRDPGAPLWKFPKATAEQKKAPARTGLAAMLVPYDDAWTRGPDIGEFGSDAALSGAQATDLRKESLRDLPRSQRRQLERQIDRQDIQGMAMRSYLGQAESLSSEDTFTASVELVQMDKGTVNDVATFQKDFLEIFDVFRKGPKIEGRKNASCFLPPKDADVKLDAVFCIAAQGDVLVTVDAYGVKPMDTKAVARLVREQLDRIDEPGEAV